MASSRCSSTSRRPPGRRHPPPRTSSGSSEASRPSATYPLTAVWRGQDRVGKSAIFHDREVSMTVPGFSFDSSVVMTKFLNGSQTTSTTLHGGSAAARSDKLTVNSKPLTGEWLIEGLNTEDGKKFQVLVHNGFMTSVNPALGRTDFSVLDVTLTLLADAGNDVWEILHES